MLPDSPRRTILRFRLPNRADLIPLLRTSSDPHMEAYKVANISNPESVLSSIHSSNNTIKSCITDRADDVKSILIQDQRYSKFSLTVDESTFANQSVLIAFVRYIKDSRICEEQIFMKTLINTTGEQVRNAASEFLRQMK